MDIHRLRYFREQLAAITSRLPFETEKKDIHTLMRDLDELIANELAAAPAAASDATTSEASTSTTPPAGEGTQS